MPTKYIVSIFLLFSCLVIKQSVAIESQQHIFKSGSYQQILDNQKDKPFILVIWSKTCASCLKDMDIIKKIHKGMPQFNFVLLATDDQADTVEVNNIIEQKGLGRMESWIFAEGNAQKLRYEIDPVWYGEIPRTYFYNSAHEREGISGALTHKQFISMISEILKTDK